jgi:uncharacterized protein (TIGR00290 family)
MTLTSLVTVQSNIHPGPDLPGQVTLLEITGLLTLFSSNDRVFMHAIRPEVLEAQAQAVELPVYRVHLPADSQYDQYEHVLGEALQLARQQGIEAIIFGDIFLEDVRRHREEVLARHRMRSVFPLWQKDTRQLAGEMIVAGVEAYTTCVDTEKLDASLVGRRWDLDFLHQLPKGSDFCGEFGEFHTFVVDGPMFRSGVRCVTGETVQRGQFIFADILLSTPVTI